MATKLKYNKAKNTKIPTLKVKTESNNLGMLKTVVVLLLILLQTVLMFLSSFYLINIFRNYSVIAFIATTICCVHVLSCTLNGQAKATWILFLIFCYTFGFIIYILSNEKILFAKAKKKYKKIYNNTEKYQQKLIDISTLPPEIKNECNYLYNYGKFSVYNNCQLKYFPSGTSIFDDIIEQMTMAKSFIFIEFFIISDGVLLKRVLDVLKQKIKEGVDVRIIYDDMGSHGKLKRKTKNQILNSGIKLQHFNRLIPIFNIALNLRDHRKIVVIDGKIAYTGGFNLADEYINEKQIYGYWKDCGIKVEGLCVDNFTISFLRQWEFITSQTPNYSNYLKKGEAFINNSIVIPYVSGPEFISSIARDTYINMLSQAKEKLYIMTPYFIPEETITNLLINKAKSGVDVKLILPDIADKKYVYVVSRDYAERLISSGVKVYTMTNSFIHSKTILTENTAIIGSINMDLRSFYQQFESAVYTNDINILNNLNTDFENTLSYSEQITPENRKRNKIFYRIIAGLFRILSPFM